MASVALAGLGMLAGGASPVMIGISMVTEAASWYLNPVVGPRVKNLQPPNSRIGETIMKGFGVYPSTGTIIWATGIKETKHSSSGKGGPREITYSYSGSFTLSFGMGPVTRVRKLYLNGAIIYDWNGGAPLGNSDYLGDKKNNAYFTYDAPTATYTSNNGKVRMRMGTESQLPDSAEETAVGAGNASAYRGEVVITFDPLKLDDFGGQWPTVSVLLEEPTTNIASIASWICDQAGIDSSDYEFCEIADINVTGFMLPQQQAASSYMNQLGLIGICDFPERDWKLRSMKRGRDVTLTVPRGDLQSHDIGSALPDMSLTRADELTLPREVDVSFIDSARNYTTSMAMAWREIDGKSNGVQSVDMSNVVMSEAQARRYGEISLYTTLAQNTSTTLSLPGSYAYLSDADVVNVETDSGTIPFLLQSSQESLFGNVVFNATSYRKSSYDYPLPDNTDGLQPSLVQTSGDYYYAMIDVNLLADNSSAVPVLLIAITTPEGTSFNDIKVTSDYFSQSQGSSDSGSEIRGFRGRVLSADNSTTNDNQFNPGSITVNDPANLGEVVGTLGAYPYGAGSDPGSFDLIDDVNTITVDMVRGTLSSLSQDQFLNQSQGQTNTFIVGKEIIKVRDWSYVGTFAGRKRYTGSYIYRGHRGTEWYSDQHHPNEAFVDITSNIYYAQLLQGSIGQSIEVDVGDPNGSNQQPIVFTYFGNNLMPYSPHNVRAARDGSGNITIQWDRRSRFSDNNWWSTGAAPELGEADESYDLEIMNSDGTAVVRTYTNLNSRNLAYGSSDQIADFGMIMNAVNVRIYQKSAIVGRGYVADAVI